MAARTSRMAVARRADIYSDWRPSQSPICAGRARPGGGLLAIANSLKLSARRVQLAMPTATIPAAVEPTATELASKAELLKPTAVDRKSVAMAPLPMAEELEPLACAF